MVSSGDMGGGYSGRVEDGEWSGVERRGWERMGEDGGISGTSVTDGGRSAVRFSRPCSIQPPGYLPSNLLYRRKLFFLTRHFLFIHPLCVVDALRMTPHPPLSYVVSGFFSAPFSCRPQRVARWASRQTCGDALMHRVSFIPTYGRAGTLFIRVGPYGGPRRSPKRGLNDPGAESACR
jgi:hypothetical protein